MGGGRSDTSPPLFIFMHILIFSQSNIFSTTKSIKNPVQHLIVTVEQLFKNAEGHFPRIADLVRTQAFQKLIARINVDEAHCFYTSGYPLYGSAPFRPARGKLHDLKLILRQSISWHLFSATFPPHILSAVKQKQNSQAQKRTAKSYNHLDSGSPEVLVHLL